MQFQVQNTQHSRFALTLFPLPANIHTIAQVHGIHGSSAVLKVGDIEVRQGVVDKAMHGAVWAVHIQVDEPGDEVRGEGDDKGLEERVKRSPWQ